MIRVLLGDQVEEHELVHQSPTSVRLQGPDGRLRRFRLRDGTCTGDVRTVHPADLARLAQPTRLEHGNTFGKRLRQAREAAGVSQAALAEALGLSGRSNVSQYEAGKTQPTLALVEECARLLGVRPEWLAGWQDEKLELRHRRARDARARRVAIEDLPNRAQDQARADYDEAVAIAALLDYTPEE